jgi:membrane dipeptidase
MSINRREFGKLMGLSVAGVAGLNMRAFAQAAETQPGGPYPDNFRAIHDGMIKIDGACPMIAQTLDPTNFNLWLDGGVNTMSLTVGGANKGAETTTNLLKWVAEQIMTRPELMLVRTTEDIRTAKRDGKLGIMFHFQGPSALGSDIERVWYYKGLGLGVLQMAYNTRNIYANGITERVDGGLSLMGQKLVKACNEARLIVDVSHTAEKSALDTIEASSEPVIMSHANARGQIDSPRNVSDDLIKAIAANGGFVGAVAYPPFVSTNQKPTMDDMVAMIDYMVQLVGPDHVTMGLDFDATTFGVMDEDKVEGIYNALVASGAWDPSAYPPPPYYYPEGMELPNTLYNLTGALLARGYSEEDLAKIWGGNWLRVMDEVWGDPTAEEIVTVETPFHQH